MATNLLRAFGEHNARGADPVYLEVAPDYDRAITFLQLELRRGEPTPMGAYVSCWLKHSDCEHAPDLATTSVEGDGWHVVKVGACSQVRRGDYEPDQVELEYYLQAAIDSEVYVFDSWGLENAGEVQD